MVVGNTGAMVAAGPLGVAATTIGWRLATLSLAAFTLLRAIVLWFVVKDSPGEADEVAGIREHSPGAGSATWLQIIKKTLSIRPIQCALIPQFLGAGTLLAF